MTGPQITGTAARYTGKWAVDLDIEPGSVPDRVMKYSRSGQLYRPTVLGVTFLATAVNVTPAALMMEAGSGFMRAARDGIGIDSISLSGPRLRPGGTPTKQDHTEDFYAAVRDTPDWVQDIVAALLTELRGA